MRTLYLCYLGLSEPLVQSQVLPYLRALARARNEVHLLTFEPKTWNAAETCERRAELEREGIHWHRLRYHKRPSLPATLFDVVVGAARSLVLVLRYRIRVLHARAHVSLAMALPVRLLSGCRLVFDFRGLVADEYVDAGLWRKGSAVFRIVKRLERTGLRGADHVVVLTQRAREWLIGENLAPLTRIAVIPCCVDASRFALSGGESENNRDLVYAGSVTGLYLLEEMADFFLAYVALCPGSRFRVITTFDTAATTWRLKKRGLVESQIEVKTVKPVEMPAELSVAAAGISLRRPGFAQIAASPTKIPEYLSAGLPVVSNTGIGDCDALLIGQRVGVVLEGFSAAKYHEAAKALVHLIEEPGVRAHCRTVALEHFDLTRVGAVRYQRVYTQLAALDRS